MFIGHYAPAFVAATHPKAPHLGVLFVAAQFVDYAFFALTLAGIEQLQPAPEVTGLMPFALCHMPYTHSLLGTLGWALAFALIVRLFSRDWTAPVVAGAVVASHWLLDLIVHRPDLTLAGAPPWLGLGLWDLPAIEMPFEALLANGALIWFAVRTRARNREGTHALMLLAVAMALFQAWNWLAPAPETVTAALPLSAITAYTALALLAWWAGENRELKA